MRGASGKEVARARAGAIRAATVATAAVATSLLAFFSMPADAAFRVESDSKRVVVTNGNAELRLVKSPLQLRMVSPSGISNLAGLKSRAEAGGVPYGGFGFTVGPEPELEPPTLYPELKDEVDTEPGARYFAESVCRVYRGKKHVRIHLTTDDPEGRRMVLKISRSPRDTFQLKLLLDRPTGVTAISAGFRAGKGEAFHGFGARRESTDLRGSDIKSWVLDYRFPDASTGYYAPVPGFISSRRYGVLLGGDRFSRWRMASDREDAWRVSKAGRSMSLFISAGGTRRSVASISARNGRHRLPPAWSTGPMLSRTIGILKDGDGAYRQRVESDVARILEGDVPVDSYAFEGWATLPDEFVRSTIGKLKREGIRSVLYLRSYVSNDIAGTETPGAFEQSINRGLVATDRAGQPYYVPSPFPGATAVIVDFTRPEARRWWRARVHRLLDTGAEGFMNDFGEQVEPGMVFADGSTGAGMHNRYPVLQAKVTRSAVDAWQRRNPGKDVFFFQRAGFSGNPGSAAFENAQFPGDETVDWDQGTGLPSIVPDMLNRAVMGAPGFTTDIGGYAQFTPSNPILPPTSAELFTRWAQASVFMPFFRVHNSGFDGAKMPWDFDQATLANFRQMAKLHDRARPLTRRLWKQFLETGIPMTRPMWMVDPQGAEGQRGDDQWLLGANLLVAPVLEPGATGREVRLPQGCWRFQGSGKRLAGGRTIEVEAPLSVLPWFTRCGTRPLKR